MEGLVRWFDPKIGYGFIVSSELVGDDGQERDVFLHYSKIRMDGFKKVEQGEKVTFDLIWTPEGKPQADNVVRLSPPETPAQE